MTLSFGGGAGVLTIPGLTSDGADGIVVAAAVTAGDIHANGDTAPDYHTFVGATECDDAKGNNADGDAVLIVSQTQGFTKNQTQPTMQLSRQSALNGHTCTHPVLLVLDRSGTGPIATFDGQGGPGAASIGNEGGIGLFGRTAPAAPVDLAQSVIDAITDANAKLAVNTIAGALAAMGVINLT